MQSETIWIKDGKEVNISAKSVTHQPDINGNRHPGGLSIEQLKELGYQEITIHEKPDDYSDETHYCTPTGDGMAPYRVYREKSDKQLAQVRWNKLKAIRDNLTENGGCFVQGKWFHTDAKSKQQQMALAMAAQHTALAVPWKTMDGTFIEMTSAIAGELFAAQMAREISIFGICEAKRLDDSDINTGWPETYSAN